MGKTVFVCGVFADDVLYRLDGRLYWRFKSCKKRCDKLNKEAGENKWIVMYTNRFNPWPYEESK